MSNDIIAIALLSLLVVTIFIRYIELRDLVKAIKAQTDALSVYLSDQHTFHADASSGLKRIEDAVGRVESKVDHVQRVIARFDRRKDVEEAMS